MGSEDGLKPDDVAVEVLMSRPHDESHKATAFRFESTGLQTDKGEHRYAIELQPELCGRLEYRVRVHPYHELLAHPFELGLMRWL